jgi:glutathione S-transferase
VAETLTLYDSPGSPCARRVRAVLLEKGLVWTTRVVDLTRLEAALLGRDCSEGIRPD